MKKVLLGLMTLIAFTAFAQSTHTIDFEPAGVGADWAWSVGENADNPPLEFVSNPDGSGINTSATAAKFTARATGNPWALCFTDDNLEFTFDADNAMVKIMVYKSRISNVGLKFEGISGGKEIQLPNTLTEQWEELTFDFSEVIGNTYGKLVIIPDFEARTEDQIVYFDNIQLPEGSLNVLPEPTTVPPTPMHAQEDVISVYGETYTNLAGTDFNPNWGQSTSVTVDYVTAGNNTLRYENLNYQGTQYANQDVSAMEFLHVDFWTPNSTALSFSLIGAGGETAYALPITAETWVSVDIPLSSFVPPVNLANVYQFKVDGNGTVYFDNWYFWKTPVIPGSDATLSNLLVDGTTVEGFSPSTLSYSVELPLGTTDVPVVSAVTADIEATYIINDAAALPGTTEVVVTSSNETNTQTYAIEFTLAGETPSSEWCARETWHFDNPAEVPSAIFLTITNFDASSMLVEIESATDDPVDLLIVTNGSGAAISGEDFSVPGKISRTLTWADTPPADVMLNILWSKETFEGNWMLSQADITVPFGASCAAGGPSFVKFKVDMSQYVGEFTNVYVSGTFNGWSGEANQLLDPDMDMIYEATLELEDGDYEYKFTLDNWAVQEEFVGGEPCTVTIEGFTNRALSVSGNVTLPAVCWNSCDACPEIFYDAAFSVDMSEFEGTYDNVFLNGSFNGWCGDCNQMLDPDMDGVYELTLPILEGNYEYKFTLDGWAQQEMFSGDEPCVVTIGGFTNRLLEVSDNTVLPLVCWNSCYSCPDYQAGWSGISSNVIPEAKISMEDLFAPVADDMLILLGKTGIYWPGYNINTIGEWDSYQGYKVKFENGVNFKFSGSELTDRTVTLEPGVYYVPVLSEGEARVEELIVPLGDAIEFMFDITNSLIYWPAGGIVPGGSSSLETLYPGYAYLAKINETLTLDFGSAPLPKASSTPTRISTQFANTNWNNVSATGIQHIVSVNTSNLLSGDIIGAFDAEGLCVGLAQVDKSDPMMPLVVFGNDITTDTKDGLKQSEAISFKMYRNGIVEDLTAVYNKTVANHNGLFAENGLSIISDFKMGTTSINNTDAHTFSIYPNPNNGQFTITSENDEIANLMLVNIQGQAVYSSQIAGSVSIDLSDQPKGVYFVRLSNASSSSIQKIVIE